MAHQYFPVRLAAADLFVGICSQLATTHILEGASCLARAANATESHDIAIRWMGVETMARLLELQPQRDLGWADTRSRCAAQHDALRDQLRDQLCDQLRDQPRDSPRVLSQADVGRVRLARLHPHARWIAKGSYIANCSLIFADAAT